MTNDPRHVERCAYCGEILDLNDSDILQLHGGENGLCHATCWRENEDDATGPGKAA